VRKTSLSSYGNNDSPTLPTAIIKPATEGLL
jgi:hypothetical protein